MSFNQSRAEKSESSHYKKLGRSGSSGQQRNVSGGNGKGGGGGTAAPSPSSLSSNRSFKKPNNAQGGPPRASGPSVTSDYNNASAARTVQNGAHVQPPLHGASDAPATGVTAKPTDVSTQKSTRVVPKAPSSHAATVTSDTKTPATPAKGDASRSFPLQFGSISPGLVKMQIPARTSSAPPNLDEQKHDQARHDSSVGVPALPTPSIPKQLPQKEPGIVDHPNSGEVHPMSKVKRDVLVSATPPATHTHRPSLHPLSGIPVQMPFHQPQVPVQFGVPNTQIQSQGMTAATSLPMPMPMPMPMSLPMGNPPQVQQQVFVPGLQPHPMQSQGIMHQGQSLNFSSQMGPHLPPQLGNLGISINPQFPQQQAGKIGGPRKTTVKITHPETHEELNFEKRSDTRMDSGPSGPRSHPNVPPQSQPITPYPTGHPINYFPSAYNTSPLFFPSTTSLSLSSNQINPSSQAPRFYNQVSQGSSTVSFMNQSALNSFSVNRTGASMHGIAESSNLEHSRDVNSLISSTSSNSVQVTVKPAVVSHEERVADSSLSVSSPAVQKSESPKVLGPHAEASSTYPQRDSETSSQRYLQQPKLGLEPTSISTRVSNKQSTVAYDSVSAESTMHNYFSSVSASAPSKDSSSMPTSSTEVTSCESVSRPDSIKDEQKKPGKMGHSLPQNQVGGKSTSFLNLPSRSLEHGDSLNIRTSATLQANLSPLPSGPNGVPLDNTSGPQSTVDVVFPGASHSKTDHAGELGMTRESVEICGAVVTVDNSLNDEQSKPVTMGMGRAEIMLPEVSTQQEGSLETSLESTSLESLEVAAQTEQSPILKVTTNNHEACSLETAQKLEVPVDSHTEDDRVAGNLSTATSSVSDAIDSEGDRTSTSDAFLSSHDSRDGKEVAGTESGLLDQESISSISEPNRKFEVEGTENISTGLVSPSASDSKDNSFLEPNKANSNMAKGKKKRKEMLQKADAAGMTSDLYMAYKGPEEKKETVTSTKGSESTSSTSPKQESADACQDDVVASEKSDQIKAEPDDWEDAADISTPKLETAGDVKQDHGGLKHHIEDGNGVVARKYSRDFLLKFERMCTEIPKGFKTKSDIPEVLMVSHANASHESYPSPGRNIDRPMGGSRLDRRASGMGDDDKWNKHPGPLVSGQDMRLDIGYGGNVVGLRPGQGGNYGVLRNPRAQIPVQYAGGILSGPMQSLGSQGGMQRNSSDSERWQRATAFQKGLIPSPQTPLQVMHKAEKKYEVGKVTDEEAAKQRQLKGILNKLTPQNFEKLFEQVKQVNIDNVVTLNGVISQIFDKALMEPTFCEMYANFCCHLAGELPDLSADNKKITFKRLLLNKCQEEFERGVREEEEANKVEEEGEAKQSDEEREEKRIRARRRMLGNIRLIGELYKKRMLTERIMHECINKLLGQPQNPDEEDVEALCKLMSTIGEMIDHPKAKEFMDAYFDMMANLSNNMKLSSRLRFMLKDSIDLRKNKWQQRRKVEGPKKIDEVHRDAAHERQAQVGRLARAPSMSSSVRRGQPMDFGPRGSSMLSSPSAQMGGFRGVSPQLRGYGTQDIRLGDKHSFDNRTLSVPLPQRPIGDDSITLGPQGGLARGMSIRGQPLMPTMTFADRPSPVDSRRMTAGLNGYSSVPERTAYGTREDLIPRHIPDRFAGPSAYDQSSTLERNMSYGNRDIRNANRSVDRSLPSSPPTSGLEPIFMQNVSSEKVWPEERLRDMSMAAIEEFYSARDVKEVAQCIKDLNAPSFYPSMISIWVTDSFERKNMERDLLAKLLVDLTTSRDVMISQDQLIKGFESALATLEDAVNDAPKAGEFLGCIFAKVILENVIPLTEIGRLIYEGGEEQGRLVEIGLAAEVLGTILETVKSKGGDSVLNEIHTNSKLRLENFRPPGSKKAWRLDKFI